MGRPIVSIIMPVYNVEKYIDRCLDSVVNSMYKNLEIIIINDCSPDNSDEIIRKYIKKDKRIVYLKNNKNLKVSETRNKGIDKASGKYLTFVDADDYISNDWIENLAETIEKKEADIVIGSAKQFVGEQEKEYRIRDLDKEKQIDFRNIRINKNGVIWNKIYKSELIKKNNIKFDKEIFKHSDVEFTYKALALANKILYNNKGFYYYRTDNESSIMKTINYEEKIKYTTMILENIYDFSEKNSKKNSKLLRKLAGDIMEAYIKSDKKYAIKKPLIRKAGFFIPEIEYFQFSRKKIKSIFIKRK